MKIKELVMLDGSILSNEDLRKLLENDIVDNYENLGESKKYPELDLWEIILWDKETEIMSIINIYN